MEEENGTRLSICMPTFNRASHIERQLSFILEEARPYLGSEIEILVSNNASPDETDRVIREIERKAGGGFSYTLQPENIGAVPNVHFLIKKAKGKYVWVVGDDDVLRSGTLTRVVSLLEQYGSGDLGAVFLGAVDDYKRENLIGGVIRWEGLTNRGEIFGLTRYDRENTQNYDFSGPFGDLLFITRSIVRRDAWLRVIAAPACNHLETVPFAAHLLSIKDRSFFVDEPISIYMSTAPNTWLHKAAEVVSVDILRCFLSLRELGFSEPEVRQIVNAFLLAATKWTIPFHPKLAFNPAVCVRFARLAAKNGYLIPFLKGLCGGIGRYLHNRLNSQKGREGSAPNESTG